MSKLNHDLPGELGTDTDRVWAKLTDLYKSAPTLRRMRDAMRVLSDELPPRVSLRQAIAFIYVADANADGRRVTMRDIRDFFSEDDGSSGAGSVANSFAVFLDDDREGSLGWIEQRMDRDDKRKRYLHLTHEGKEVAMAIADRMSAELNAEAEDAS